MEIFIQTIKLNDKLHEPVIKAQSLPKEAYTFPKIKSRKTIKLDDDAPVTAITNLKEQNIDEISKDWAKSKLYQMVKALIDLPREGRK